MTVTRTAVCTVKGCPEASNPDWHIPWCQGIHECFGGATHQHWPKRSQGGKEIVACLCAGAHDRIDNGDWGNDVKDIPGRGRVYFAWDIHGNTLIEREVMPDAEKLRRFDQRAVGRDGQVLSAAAEEEPSSRHEVAPVSEHEVLRQAPLTLAPSAAAPSAKEEDDGIESGDGGGRADDDGLRVESANEDAPLDALPALGGSTAGVQRSDSHLVLTHEQRVAIAQQIKDTEWNRQWVAGDTANAWRAELGEEAEQYIDDFGYVQESIANIMRVCEAIPSTFRHGGLRFSHHVVVVGLNREDMEMWLDACEANEWSVAEFRRQVKGTKPRVRRYTASDIHDIADEYPFEPARDEIKDFADWLGVRDE